MRHRERETVLGEGGRGLQGAEPDVDVAPSRPAPEHRQVEQAGRAGRSGRDRRDDRGVGQDAARCDVATAGHRISRLPHRPHRSELASGPQAVHAGRPAPRVDAGPGGRRPAYGLELLVSQLELALAAELVLERVTQLEEHLDVEGGVDEPRVGQRPGGPVGGRVALLEPQPEHPLDHRAEPDPLEPGQPAGQLGVEDPAGHEPHLGEAGEVLAGGVQDPLVVLEHGGQLGQVGAPDRVDEGRPGATATQLDQVGPLGVAVAGRALGVDRHRPGARREAGDELGEGRRGRGDRRNPVARGEEQLYVDRCVDPDAVGRSVRMVAGHAPLVVTRQGRRHDS